MDKRYQIFVSSTYVGLIEERQKVIQTLLEADCIPAGMELFPATDEEQFNFIKSIIDDCDYYLLIIGGRYGSVDADGISYTEKEYDYAISLGLKVMAFVISDPARKEKLREFRDRVCTGRMVKPWTVATDLPGLVALSVQKTIKSFPATGWIRANQATTVETLSELNEVRKENERLKNELRKLRVSIEPDLTNLASLDETIAFTIHYTYQKSQQYSSMKRTVHEKWSESISWRDLFRLLSPHLLKPPADSTAKKILGDSLSVYFTKPVGTLEDEVFQTIKIHLSALKLVEIEYSSTVGGGMGLFWNLTRTGKALMMELRSVRSAS